MRCNVAAWDRALRWTIGFLLLAWSLAGGAAWGLIGIYMLITGSYRFCPVYSLLKIQTISQ